MKRYNCTCDPQDYNEKGDQYSYPRQQAVELPEWSISLRSRLRRDLSNAVAIDQCIVDAIKELWEQGIETEGCCCGHNVMRGWVTVHPGFYQRMFELGYEQRPVDVKDGVVMGLYTFYL